MTDASVLTVDPPLVHKLSGQKKEEKKHSCFVKPMTRVTLICDSNKYK